MFKRILAIIISTSPAFTTAALADFLGNQIVYQAGHPSLKSWRLLEQPPYPQDNRPTQARTNLGKALFFDPRLSRKGNISCSTCHNPGLGWADGLTTSVGFNGKILRRASPTILNAAYNQFQMWDGRMRSLEDQVLGPMESHDEMNTDFEKTLRWLKNNHGYSEMFSEAYPGETISLKTLAKAIASYERTIIAQDTPFDRWVRGDKNAMTNRQIHGFQIFSDPEKGNCVVCHQPPNFTDDGFHNIGLRSFSSEQVDLGRFDLKPVKILKGAFKTPSLRGISETPPYFHDGSAVTLNEVIEHYIKGGDVKENLSPNMKPIKLGKREKRDLQAFLSEALKAEPLTTDVPRLPN